MAVKIRPVTLEDAASYRQCWDTVARERRHIWWYEAPPLPRLRTNLRKSLRQKTPFLVAVDGARVIGWTAVFRPGTPSLSHNGDLLVMLLPEYRRKGLGRKLAAAVLKACRGKFDAVTFCFFGKNKAARKLAKSLGFAICGREKKAVKLAYGFDDQLITQKRLPAGAA